MACIFTFFGISLLAATYRFTDPYSFIMTFFTASLITLVSLGMAIEFVMRMGRALQKKTKQTYLFGADAASTNAADAIFY